MSTFPTQHPNTNPMFNFEGHDVRVVMIDGNPWFVASDALRVLYPNFDPDRGVNNYVQGVMKDELMKTTRALTPGLFAGKTGCPTLTLVSESGLYKLVMRANTGNAKVIRFQNWVTREVLPALRKDGMYVMGEEKVKTGGQGIKFRAWFVAAPATSRPLALQHQGEDGGCILGCPTYETRSTIAACCGVWHTLGQNL